MTDYAWFDKGDGRQVYRRIRRGAEAPRSDLPCPMLISDQIEPTKSMVDGQYYTSKAALRATYKPSGNATGDRYIEVGNEELRPPAKRRPDRREIRESIEKAASRAGVLQS